MCGYEGRLHLLPLASLLPQPLTYSNKFFPSSYTNPKRKPLNTLTHLSVVYPNLSQQFLSLEQPDPATFHILPRLGHIRFTALSSLTHRQALLTTHCQDLTGSHAHLVVLRLDCRLTQLPTTKASKSKIEISIFWSSSLTMTCSSNTRTAQSFANGELLRLPRRPPLHLQHPVIPMGTHTHYKHSSKR